MGKIVRKTLFTGVELSCIYTDKFKSGMFGAYLLQELNREDTSKNSLFANVLRRGCTAYPDMRSIEMRLGDLYGASVDTRLLAIGETQAVGFTAFFADDRFLPGDEHLLEDTLLLTGSLLLSPATKGGLLNSDYVQSERDNLCDRIRSAVNNKRQYAQIRLKEIMFKDENYGAYQLGTVESAEKINNISLTKHYKNVLEKSPLMLFYCGGASPERVEAAVIDAFGTLPRGDKLYAPNTEVRLSCEEPRYIAETMDVAQGNLAIGLRLGEIMYKPDYAAIEVFNAVLGGSPVSKLFTNVRERLSLCYSVGSGIDLCKGVMFITAGIDSSKYEQALDEIMAQLKKCCDGDISAAELDAAKKYVSSSLLEVSDSAADLDYYWLRQYLRNTDISPEEHAALVEDVSIDDIVRVAQSLKLDTTYFLKGTV